MKWLIFFWNFFKVEQNLLNWKTKTITAYYGNLVYDPDDEKPEVEPETMEKENLKTEMKDKEFEEENFETVDVEPFSF